MMCSCHVLSSASQGLVQGLVLKQKLVLPREELLGTCQPLKTPQKLRKYGKTRSRGPHSDSAQPYGMTQMLGLADKPLPPRARGNSAGVPIPGAPIPADFQRNLLSAQLPARGQPKGTDKRLRGECRGFVSSKLLPWDLYKAKTTAPQS